MRCMEYIIRRPFYKSPVLNFKQIKLYVGTSERVFKNLGWNKLSKNLEKWRTGNQFDVNSLYQKIPQGSGSEKAISNKLFSRFVCLELYYRKMASHIRRFAEFLRATNFRDTSGHDICDEAFWQKQILERMPEYGFSLTRIFPYTGKYRSEETHVLACFRQCSVPLYFNYFTVFCSNYYTIMECIKVNENIAINWVNLNNYLFCN